MRAVAAHGGKSAAPQRDPRAVEKSARRVVMALTRVFAEPRYRASPTTTG
jgi:hypothetical protein